MTEAEQQQLIDDHFLFDKPVSPLLLASGMARDWPDARGIWYEPSPPPPSPEGWARSEFLACAVLPSAQMTLVLQMTEVPALRETAVSRDSRVVTSLFGVCSPPSSWEPALLVFSPPSHPLIPPGLCQVPVTQKPPHPSGQGSYPCRLRGRRRASSGGLLWRLQTLAGHTVHDW